MAEAREIKSGAELQGCPTIPIFTEADFNFLLTFAKVFWKVRFESGAKKTVFFTPVDGFIYRYEALDKPA